MLDATWQACKNLGATGHEAYPIGWLVAMRWMLQLVQLGV
jgi:hypothetical protein